MPPEAPGVVVVGVVWVGVVVVGCVWVRVVVDCVRSVVVCSVVDGVVVWLVVVSVLPWHLLGSASRSFRLLAPLSRAFLTSEFTLEGRFWMSARRSSVLEAATRQLPTSTFARISEILESRV